MKAMVVKDERLFLEDVEMPNVNDDEIRIKVKAIGINRADLLQKKGTYPICFASIFSYSIWFTVVKNGELSKLFIIKFAEPVFACIFGAILLGENIFKVQYILAFLLIAGGIYISNK